MKLEEQWAEALALLFLVLGFFLAVALQSPLFSYVTIFLSGLMAGRVYYIRRYKEPIFPFVLIILGFLLGYFIGGFWVERVVVLVLFAVSAVLSYQLHLKKVITIFKNEGFVK